MVVQRGRRGEAPPDSWPMQGLKGYLKKVRLRTSLKYEVELLAQEETESLGLGLPLLFLTQTEQTRIR